LNSGRGWKRLVPGIITKRLVRISHTIGKLYDIELAVNRFAWVEFSAENPSLIADN
jgi:hypothetical protein